jgi:hypothetical protein
MARLESPIGQIVNKETVEFRVREWKERLADLYTQIISWLPKGYTADTNESAIMNEDLMKRYKMPAQRLPILKIIKNKEVFLSFEPKGLWVIGANGRVDVFRLVEPIMSLMLVDMAEPYSGKTDWRVLMPGSSSDFRKINKTLLNDLLSRPDKFLASLIENY